MFLISIQIAADNCPSILREHILQCFWIRMIEMSLGDGYSVNIPAQAEEYFEEDSRDSMFKRFAICRGIASQTYFAETSSRTHACREIAANSVAVQRATWRGNNRAKLPRGEL